MSDPVTVTLELEKVKDIKRVLQSLTYDLEAELGVRYPQKEREMYPTYQRRWDNDMEMPRQAHLLIQELEQKWGI